MFLRSSHSFCTIYFPVQVLGTEEDVSVYDIADHPDFHFRTSDIVIRIWSSENGENDCENEVRTADEKMIYWETASQTADEYINKKKPTDNDNGNNKNNSGSVTLKIILVCIFKNTIVSQSFQFWMFCWHRHPLVRCRGWM